MLVEYSLWQLDWQIYVIGRLRLSFIVFLGALMGIQTPRWVGSGHTFVETARHQDWPANAATTGTPSDPHVLNPFARPQS